MLTNHSKSALFYSNVTIYLGLCLKINKQQFYNQLKFVFAKNFGIAWLGSNPSYAPEKDNETELLLKDFIMATNLLSLLAISYQDVLFRLSFLTMGMQIPKKVIKGGFYSECAHQSH